MESEPQEKKSFTPLFLAAFVIITVGVIVSVIITFGPQRSSSLSEAVVNGVDTFASQKKSGDELAVNPTDQPFIQENAKIDKKTTWNTYSNNILGIEFKYSPEFNPLENVTGGTKDMVDFISNDRQFKIQRSIAGNEQSGPFKLNSIPKEINGITWQMVAADKNSSVPPSYSISRNGYDYIITYTPNMEKEIEEILSSFKFNN